MANNSSAEDVQNWILQKSGTFDNQAAQDAASTLQDWNNKGYMPEGVNAVDASTALSRFCNGEGLFFPSGNWNLDTVAKALGDDVQFFAFPGATSEDEPNVAANAGAFYGIPVNAKNRASIIRKVPKHNRLLLTILAICQNHLLRISRRIAHCSRVCLMPMPTC